jgi:AmmeMemoRadiSam system protein B
MAPVLARLRPQLDVMPSPVAEQPGLLLRDPLLFSRAVVIVPPPLVPLLLLFDGRKTEADLREALVRVSGDLRVGGLVDQLVRALSENGFLEDEAFERMRAERLAAFAAAPQRGAAHAGAAYPAEADALRERLAAWMDGSVPHSADGIVGIAAPHVSPEGGLRCYRDAYASLGTHHRERTCVILGTSHYGEAGRFGLTRKPFVTPLAEARVDLELADELAGRCGPALQEEDYCHAIEHSIEFQVVFLQHVLGPEARILPVLCGPLGRAGAAGERPEDQPEVARFLEGLAELAVAHGDRLLWVLGVDMAHMGRRYGDPFEARAEEGPMAAVAGRDRERIEALSAGDAAGFWDQVRGPLDELKWCGASPFYVFLRAAGQVRGELRSYEQWNIDPASVVSFAGMVFRR